MISLMVIGVRTLSSQVQLIEARRQLSQLEAALERYRAACGVYPQVYQNPELLSCLLGRIDAWGRPGNGRIYLNDLMLSYSNPNPDAPGNQIVDPWGRPYHYAPWSPNGFDGYVLVSSGPDGKTSLPPGLDGAASANEVDRDNIAIFR